MTRTLLVAPTGHRVGLTSTSLGLVAALDRAGVAIGFAKPILQPRSDGIDHSEALIRLTSKLQPATSILVERAEELLGQGRQDDLMEEVVAVTESLAGCDVIVVEGLVPTADRLWSTRLNTAMARAMDADVLLVAEGVAHSEDHLAEAVAIAASPYRSGEQLRVAGCVVNRVRDLTSQRSARLAGALARHGIALAGAVPFRPELGWPRLADVVRELGARTLVAGDDSRRVREIVICAQAVPSLLPMLQDGRLLLVPGDRHDVVMAACLAALNGVRLHNMNPEVPTDDAERAGQVAQAVADALYPSWLQALPEPDRPRRLTPAAFRHHLVELARAARARIVLPEGAEPRTIQAAVACAQRGIARSLLLASPAEVAGCLRILGIRLPDGVDVVDPDLVAGRYVDRLVELRAHRGVTRAIAEERLADPITLGTMMLAAGEVDGLVSGAVHTTSATVRPALELNPDGAARPAGVRGVLHVPAGRGRRVRGLRHQPQPQRNRPGRHCPAERGQCDGARYRATRGDDQFQHRIVRLWGGRRRGDRGDQDCPATTTRPCDRRATAVRRGRRGFGGPEQATRPHRRRPGHGLYLSRPYTGNTTCKAVQRSADVVSIGPMLQGLAKPVNDLSRGALVEDIVYTIALTAIQAAARRA